MTGKITTTWATPSDNAPQLAHFFISNITESYISQGDVLCGRALDTCKWSDAMPSAVISEFTGIISGDHPGNSIAIAREGELIVGLAVIRECLDHAVLEDFVVSGSQRGKGVGSKFLSQVIEMLQVRGTVSVFLESGIQNQGAHKFFQRAGFDTVSVSLSKKI